MINANHKGWLSWSFDNIVGDRRRDKNAKHNLHFNVEKQPPVESYYKELYKNAQRMRDTFSGQFDVLFSGGIDSEVVVRTFKDLGIKHNTFIFRFENQYNYRDVESAIKIAEGLNIPYKIVDFSLQKFFENDAYDIFKKSGCIRSARLPHLKFSDYLDNIPVMGDAEPYWMKKDGEWKFALNESNHNCSIYLCNQGRENICDWYEYTPNVIRSFIDLPIIQDLFNDKLVGKKSSWSSRVAIHQALWPDIQEKPKLVGYEGDQPSGTYPEFINSLQRIMEDEVGLGDEHWFTVEELNAKFY